ncbi:MAG: Hsp20/alpha crystallin family protein [Actinomycetota bacterium]
MAGAFRDDDDFDEVVVMRAEMERFFSHLPRWKKPSAVFEKAWKPLCDVYECPDHFMVLMDLAGVDENAVEVTLHGRVLRIRGRRNPIRPAGVKNTYLLEIGYGEFERTFELPADIDPEGTRAVYRRGFLEIHLPKRERQNLRSVDVCEE